MSMAPLTLDSLTFHFDLKYEKWIDLDICMYDSLCCYYTSSTPMEYLEMLKHTKYDLKKNIELGCHALIIKNYKTFEYMIHHDGTSGIGISSTYIPIADFIAGFELSECIAEFKSQMDSCNLGIYMMITKEFRKDENNKDVLFKEIMLFYDEMKLCKDCSQIEKLITALEDNKALQLSGRKNYVEGDRDIKLIRWSQDNIKQDRKTLDKFLKEFYAKNMPADM